MNIPGFPYAVRDEFSLAGGCPIVVHETSGVAPLYQRLHWHDLLEINLIKSGTGYYLINGQTIEFQQGDILLINSNDMHRAYEREGLDMLIVSFDPSWLDDDLRYDPTLLSPFREMGTCYRNLLPRHHPIMDELRTILSAIWQEHDQRAHAHIPVMRAQLVRFLAYVAREFRCAGPSQSWRLQAAQDRQMGKIREVISLMEKDYAGDWDLKSLSDLAYLSPSRFSAIFKQAVGLSPMDYLIQIRLSHAVDMLESSDRKIVDIAFACGFQNLSNFNRLFKGYIGVSPSRVRMQAVGRTEGSQEDRIGM